MANYLTKSQNTLCSVCADTLFGKETDFPEDFNNVEILNEAMRQTVFPIAWVGLKSDTLEKVFYSDIAKNIQVNYNHTEIADLLSQNGIKYVFIKGVASASYYKQPQLRTMGDVDVLIKRSDTQKINDLLQKLGYTTDDDIFKKNGHIVYKRKINGIIAVCEVHFKLNGIPISLEEIFEKHLNSIFQNAEEITVTHGKCSVPSDFHHGIILLLHTATHLTSEGIGLRHLCDWAVFVNSFSNEEFVSIFQKALTELGLWRFAQLLTLCCIKYLGCDKKTWVGKADDCLLEDIITDILNGGNFGRKDFDRYAQIKYISDREKHEVSQKTAFLQALSSINAKAKSKYDFAKKHKLLLPIGWLAVIFDYFILVLTRKRRLDNINTINTAKHRQCIYNQFKLFEKDNFN